MAEIWKSPAWELVEEDWTAPVFGAFGVILTGAAGIYLLLYLLCQPTVKINPGLAAYTPPPATRLVPLPRKSDAPEVADLSGDPESPLSALAQAQTNDRPARHDTHPPARKRLRYYDQRGVGFVPQRDLGYPGWGNSRPHSGGPQSWSWF